jgi:hypothetical protein
MVKAVKQINTPEEYFQTIEEPRRGEIIKLFELIKKARPDLEVVVESSGIGFGKYHYVYANGKEADWPKIGIMSQKNHISLYVSCISDDDGKYIVEKYAKQLGKLSVGKSCIRFKKFEELNLPVLMAILKEVQKGDFTAPTKKRVAKK